MKSFPKEHERFDQREIVNAGHHKRNRRAFLMGGELMMAKYQVILTQDEDGVYVAECPAIPDHGKDTLGLGLLKRQIVHAGLKMEEFLELLKDA